MQTWPISVSAEPMAVTYEGLTTVLISVEIRFMKQGAYGVQKRY